eukprot:gene12311-5985_t
MFLSKEDYVFLNEWENCDLLFEKWTHKSHLRMAFIICVQMFQQNKIKIDERIKSGIKRFNKKHEEKLKVGYHETITCFWINIIYSLIKIHYHQNISFEEFLEKENQLLNPKLMFEYYSKEKIFSEKAKIEFVESDLK